MTVRAVKYVCVVAADTRMVCTEGHPGCEDKAVLHVCFDEGNGEFVCRHCFDKMVNQGAWRTDRAGVLLAS